MKKVLFVCMGNICRSPSAEAVFTQLVKQRGLDHEFEIDSAGTHSYHVGSPPDRRSMRAARNRGIEMAHLRARQVVPEDYDRFDWLVVMDQDNRDSLVAMFPTANHSKVHGMMDFAKQSAQTEVPDPYYGGGDGFELVLDLLEDASLGLLDHVNAAHEA
ncbi:low molecular weight protein-tyrosine-phosphatase [Marinicella meishanensis]|uniref:low molecular weight protein-tyrosine-phosphatase n=1 Tax=Marinicella meishanensis TaxID=2873263 RepID=UPI001CBAC2DD|nr:low molecular weight protein-tyrosine-phosphatase [Marinicella sp. NBU2979]